MDLTEAEDIKKRWQEYTEEPYKKDLHDPDNHNGVITHLEPDDVENLGMICGGAVNVFFHYIPAGDEDTLALTREAERIFAAGEDLWLLSDIGRGGALSLYTRESGFFGTSAPDWLPAQLTRAPKLIELEGETFCTEQINCAGKVYILGGGHVSQELEPVLTHVGFRCVVMDDRPEFVRRELKEAMSLGVKDYWIINSSNVKPHVYTLDLIAALWRDGDVDIEQHMLDYAARYYGAENAASIIISLIVLQFLSYLLSNKTVPWNEDYA